MAAPMTGATTNMNNAISEYDYALTVLQGSIQSGSLAWLGDGATPDKYKTMLGALQKVNGQGILICKPRADEGMIRERFEEAEAQGILGLGMDIDAFQFKTLVQKNQQAPSRTFKDIARIRAFTKLPFIIKGVMTVEDASMSLEIGASAIVVSNHGGRVLDDMPGTARVLPSIADKLKGKIPILVDGGIRSGMDVFKMLALGADGVLIGRPIAIYAVGGGIAGVKFLYNQVSEELKNSMNITGSSFLKNIKKDMVLKK
jgi:isopentenyl diphosphate isomerase/L-lactate dehydrogenase-like FMN-dependent dehydrogenase